MKAQLIVVLILISMSVISESHVLIFTNYNPGFSYFDCDSIYPCEQ